LIDIIMGYECNVQCDYCTVSVEMRGKNLTTGDIARALERGVAEGLTKAAFGGGEPTIRKDLVKLVNLASALGFKTVKISSNGLMYSYAEFVEALMKAGANQFNISVMGWNRQGYERIMGNPDYFELVRDGVSNLVERGATVVADVIMKRDTYKELEQTVEYWAELGVERFVFWLMSLTDRVKDERDSLVPVSTMRPHIYRAFEVGRRRGIPVHSRHIPRCMLPGYWDHVWDVRTDRVLIVTPESSFWLSESRITANTLVEKCGSCVVMETCMGVRQDYLDNVGDEEVAPVTRDGVEVA